MLDSPRRIGRELDAAGFLIALDESVQPRLVNRYLAALESLDLGRIHVHAHHVVAGIREAGASDETHVARAEDGDAHEVKIKFLRGKAEGGETLKESHARLKRGGRSVRCADFS